MTIPPLQAVIFDFDGVLVDSEPAHYRAFQAVLEPRGLGYDWATYLDHYIGFDDRDGFREAYAAAGRTLSATALEELIAAKGAAFETEMAAGLAPIEGAVACVQRLGAAFPLALCSGALRGEIVPTLEQLGLSEAFGALVSAEDVAHSKPDPESYRLAVARLGAQLGQDLPTAACAAIEDTPAGVASAAGAGLRVVGLAHGPDHGLDGAHAVVESLAAVDPAFLHNLG